MSALTVVSKLAFAVLTTPKSMMRGPSGPRMMLPGLRSRWMSPQA